MPEPNLSQLAAATWDGLVTKSPMDNIFGALKLAKAIQSGGGMIEKTSTPGGKTFEYTVEYAVNSTFRAYGEFEVLDMSRISTFTAAQYQQKQHAGTVIFTDWEQLQTQPGNAKFDYVADKLENGKNSHLNDLNTTLFLDGTQAGGNAIAGLGLMIPTAPTTGIVGGIDPAVWIFWRSQQISGAHTTTAFDTVRSTFQQIYDLCSRGGDEEAPTNIITDRASFEGFRGTLTTYERYNKDGSNPRGADLGWKNDALQFNGASVEYDEAAAINQPTNAYFFGGKFLQFAFLKGGWMKLSPAIDIPNQLGVVYRIATYGQLCSGERRRIGVVSGIT